MAKEAVKEIIPVVPEVLISFDRYFTLTGKPDHHKAGMMKFTKEINYKKSKVAWDLVFKNY